MATEVELKAHLENAAETEARVRSFAAPAGSFDRSDLYFRTASSTTEYADFRLRTDGPDALVTFKRKTVADGLETNDEREFSVSDPAAFLALAERIGCRVSARKHKHGRTYRFDALTIEIAEVDGLGHFIEIEKLLEAPDAEALERAGREIRSVLCRAGVGEDRIEPENYIDLLAKRD